MGVKTVKKGREIVQHLILKERVRYLVSSYNVEYLIH